MTGYDERSGEITLVDLVKILVKKKVLVISVFVVLIIASLSYALIMPKNYQYTSIYQVAEIAPGVALESTQSLIAKTNNVYFNSLISEYLDEFDLVSMPFEIEVNSPRNTLLLRLVTQEKNDEADAINTFHERTLERIIVEQNTQLEKRREILEARLESIQNSIESLSNSNNPMTAELIAHYSTQASELQESLANLLPGNITHTASESVEPVGRGRFYILLVGGMLSVLIAIGAAFLASFIGVVKDSLEND